MLFEPGEWIQIIIKRRPLVWADRAVWMVRQRIFILSGRPEARSSVPPRCGAKVDWDMSGPSTIATTKISFFFLDGHRNNWSIPMEKGCSKMKGAYGYFSLRGTKHWPSKACFRLYSGSDQRGLYRKSAVSALLNIPWVLYLTWAFKTFQQKTLKPSEELSIQSPSVGTKLAFFQAKTFS